MTSKDLGHLPNELISALQGVYASAELTLTTLPKRDAEGAEYGACSFHLNGRSIVFRTAKTTPTKIGQFVTLWKRSQPSSPIAPFDSSDNIDFVVVSVSDGIHRGQFVFNQKILIAKGILSQDTKGGKRAFRLYPPWTKPSSPQALKTQQWQLSYFFKISESGNTNLKEVLRLFSA